MTVDDLYAAALDADLLIHYGHSCLVPVDNTVIPCLYVFVDIKIDVDRLVNTVKLKFDATIDSIQFATAIRYAKSELENPGFRVLIPQSKPLSAGEVLGCTAPSIPITQFAKESDVILVFLAGEEYDHVGMKKCRKNAILKSRSAKNWGIVLGTRILDRLEKKMGEKGYSWTIVLMSELSPARIALFGDSVDAWIQIVCHRLSIDWGDTFVKPLLTPFEVKIALGDPPGWWEKKGFVKNDAVLDSGCNNGVECCKKSENNGVIGVEESGVDYPMDYYSQDGGQWNCCYSKKLTRPLRRNNVLKS